MNKVEKIQEVLDTLFPNPPIPLTYTNHYTFLIAVLLSAQSTDIRVNTITPILFSNGTTPEEILKLSIEEITQIIKPCGLGPTKAKAIWNLSKILLEKHNSKVPSSFPELEALPGVGHKTASVIMSQAFNKPAFPVDTHIHRCAKRWELTEGKNVIETEKDLKSLFPEKHWGKVHLQIIYFAREYCPARGHESKTCPICSLLPSNRRKK